MKIGFLAMSGVRVKDEKLLALGLTLPGFVERSKVVAQLPSLGLLYLAAVTPSGHELKYFEAEADGKEPVEVYDCDLVAISTFSAQVKEAYNIANRLRAAGVIVAMGGLHVSSLPEEAKQFADHVVVGEGEYVWPEVVKAVTRGDKGKIWLAKDYGLVDISNLPLPRYDLLPEERYNRFTIQSSRGCPWRCEFCASNVMLGLKYRKRPVEQVIRDIQAIIALRKHPFIEFADDNTFVDKSWGKKLCRALIPLKLKWFTETDISVAEDEELLELMAESGCRQVLIGLESPNQAPLKGLELNANFKARSANRYLQAIEKIQAKGITVNGCFILGLDGHNLEIFDQVLKFAQQASLFEVQITILTAFPGTPLYQRLLLEKRIIKPEDWNSCTLFDVNYLPKQMSPDQLRTGLYYLAEKLYESPAVKKRREGFFQQRKNAILNNDYQPLAA